MERQEERETKRKEKDRYVRVRKQARDYLEFSISRVGSVCFVFCAVGHQRRGYDTQEIAAII